MSRASVIYIWSADRRRKSKFQVLSHANSSTLRSHVKLYTRDEKNKKKHQDLNVVAAAAAIVSNVHIAHTFPSRKNPETTREEFNHYAHLRKALLFARENDKDDKSRSALSLPLARCFSLSTTTFPAEIFIRS